MTPSLPCSGEPLKVDPREGLRASGAGSPSVIGSAFRLIWIESGPLGTRITLFA
jgi:hypothetical protein